MEHLSSAWNWYIIHEQLILHAFSFIMIAVGAIVFCILLYIPATYGRYSATGRFYSLPVPANLAWLLQEIPAVLVPLSIIMASHRLLPANEYRFNEFSTLIPFLAHYIYRSLVYAYQVRGGKPTPLYAFVLAMVFCAVNGFMQARGVVRLTRYDDNVLVTARMAIGALIWLAGLSVNINADRTLRDLRKPGETGYKIPTGGLFEYVSCANFFGEIVEWFGYAVMCFSSVSFAFAFFTAANLVPRALSHHAWYAHKFEDYPPNRKAVIPFIL